MREENLLTGAVPWSTANSYKSNLDLVTLDLADELIVYVNVSGQLSTLQ